jgi:hypothetical protein
MLLFFPVNGVIHSISFAFWDGVSDVGMSRWFKEKSKRMSFFVNQRFLDKFRTWFRAFLKSFGFEDRGYRQPFISCIVLKMTFRFNSFIVLKNAVYCSSNFQSATSFAEY